MSWLTDTVAGRTIIVLVVGLGSILALAQYLYQRGIEREVTAGNTAAVVERILVLANTIMAIDPERRDDAAHRLSGGLLELHWGPEPLATPGGPLDPVVQRLRDGLISKSPRLQQNGLVIGTTRRLDQSKLAQKAIDERHTTLLSLPLSDSSWLNVTLARVETGRAATPSALLSALLGALGVILVAILMGQWLTRPLQQLSEGARLLFQTPGSHDLPETGTREVRTLARAVNELQHRIRKLVDDRTQMLAAVSHDLRTPLTRLRLRATNIGDSRLRRTIETDLDEMEDMIEATLAFLHDDLSKEKVESVDLMAILETIQADASDASEHVEVKGPRQLVIVGRYLALKRALTNLIQNAVKYGMVARVRVSSDGDNVFIIIEDDGPGLPIDLHETVFEPFVRCETSRSRSTGGHGLGLSMARSVLRSHGGEVSIANGEPHGLKVIVQLPRRRTESYS